MNTAIYTGITRDLIRRIYEHKHHVDPNSYTAKYDITKLVYSISWYDEPSVNGSGENLEEIYGYDELEQYIKNFPNKQIAEMALEYLEKYYVEEYEDTLELVDIDEVPDYD